MAYQVIGLREHINSKTKVPYKRQAFVDRQWGTQVVEEIFKNPKKILEPVPEAERVNLYFTVADCFEQGEARKLREQWLMPFDIDSIGVETNLPEENLKLSRKVLDVCYRAVNVDPKKTASLFSGNGVQFFVKMKAPILSEDYFDSAREQYKLVVDKINNALKLAGLKGSADPAVFSAARLMRMPETLNRKPNKGERMAFVIDENLETQDFTLDKLVGTLEIKDSGNITKEAWKNYGPPDVKAVLEGCEFLKYVAANAEKLSEPEWHAEAHIKAFMPDGEKLFHETSQRYPHYDAQEAQDKFDQAKRMTGPMGCKKISSISDACKTCKFNGLVSTPLAIKGPDYIKTASSGFRKVTIDENGKPKTGKVEYDDLVKYFLTEFTFKKIDKNGSYIYSKEEKKWISFSHNRLKEWCSSVVKPPPSAADMSEFIARLEAKNVTDPKWLNKMDTENTNFNNGVLHRETKTLKAHSPEYNFRYCLPFDYNPHAKAPMFQKFMEDITCENQDTKKLLLEYCGYAISGDDYWEHTILLLVGEGANGKSTLIDLLKYIVGENNYSGVPIKTLYSNTGRHHLVNKLFNASDETNLDSFLDSGLIKNLTGGGEMEVKHLYEQPFMYRNSAKLITACNELPYIRDKSHGMQRRFLIASFNATFDGKLADKFIKNKLKAEASGIYNILLSHYAEMKERQEFTKTKETGILYKEMSQSAEDTFIEDFLVVDKEIETSLDDIYSAYENFLEVDGHNKNHKKPKTVFTKIVMKRYGFVESIQKRVDNKRVRVLKGVRLIEGAII